MKTQMTGARMVVQALKDQGVEVVFGYPGGAVLPIYDEIFQQNDIRHILVRHEQGAVHMAEGYARSTGKPGVALVTSGPGATNAVTGLTDALMDSINHATEQSLGTTVADVAQAEAALCFAALTARQKEVMDMVLAGHPSKNIAADLGISQRTVENHRAEVMHRMGVRSLPELARKVLMLEA